MSVQEQTPYVEYKCNGTTKIFPLKFDCDDSDHLIVMLDGIAPAVGEWVLNGESVVFHTAPKVGSTLTIQRNSPLERLNDYDSYNNSMRPQTFNMDFDRIWWKLQELGLADWLTGLKLEKEIQDRIAADIYYYTLVTKETDNKINDLKDYIDALINNISGGDFLPILDKYVKTWNGGTQEEINKGFYKMEGGFISSASSGLVPNSNSDQTLKLIEFLSNDGVLILKPGVYRAKGYAPTIYLKSNTTLLAYGAIIDFSEATNTSTGRIRSENLNILEIANLKSDSALNSNNIAVDDSARFNIGDVIKITSTDRFSSDCYKAEYLKISNIENDTLYFYEALRASYDANTTMAIKQDLAQNISILGLTVRGRGGKNVEQGLNERAFLLRGIENLILRDVQVDDFDRMGIVIGDTYKATIENCNVNLAERKKEEYKYIQYGISIADANRYTNILNNTVLGCKHCIAFTSYSGIGFSVSSFISGNHLSGSWASAIATHMTNTILTINGNHISSCGGGIDIRIPSVNVHDNHIINIKDSIVILRGMVSDINIYNNKFAGATWGIRTATPELTPGYLNRIKIRNNKINMISNMAILIVAGNVRNCQLHDYSNNEFSNISGDGVRLIGDIVSPDITNNTHKNDSISSVGFGVYLSGIKGARVCRNYYEGVICVRLDTNGSDPTINTAIIDNSYTRDSGLLSAAANSTGGLIRSKNMLLSNPSVSVVEGVVKYPNGSELLIVSALQNTDINSISAGTIGDVVTLFKTGSYALTLRNNVGNLRLQSDFVLDSFIQNITLAFNGSTWCETSRSLNV